MKLKEITLADGVGNCVHGEIYQISPELCELFLHSFNCGIPTHYRGPLNILENVLENWAANREKNGFKRK